MNKKNILVVTNPELMNDELLAWISTTKNVDMTFAEAHEQAIELAHQQLFDLVLIDTTDENINAKKLKVVLPILNAEVLLVRYNGESMEQVETKIKEAFDFRTRLRMKRLLILDSSGSNKRNSLPPFSDN